MITVELVANGLWQYFEINIDRDTLDRARELWINHMQMADAFDRAAPSRDMARRILDELDVPASANGFDELVLTTAVMCPKSHIRL